MQGFENDQSVVTNFELPHESERVALSNVVRNPDQLFISNKRTRFYTLISSPIICILFGIVGVVVFRLDSSASLSSPMIEFYFLGGAFVFAFFTFLLSRYLFKYKEYDFDLSNNMVTVSEGKFFVKPNVEKFKFSSVTSLYAFVVQKYAFIKKREADFTYIYMGFDDKVFVIQTIDEVEETIHCAAWLLEAAESLVFEGGFQTNLSKRSSQENLGAEQ